MMADSNESSKTQKKLDTISRQAAIDAILHNQEVYANNFGDDPIDKYTIAIIDNDARTIAQLPTAEPQIIRCKDCRYWEKYKSYATKGVCKMWGETERTGKDFCSEARCKDG